MRNPVRYSAVILQMIGKSVSETEPVIRTKRGNLYLLPKRSMGAIQLEVQFADYLEFLESVDTENRPKARWLVPVEDQDFQLVVDTPIEVRDGKTFADGREVVFL